jgi:hypothetical protein
VRRHLVRLVIVLSLLAVAFVLPSAAQAGPLVFKASEDATVVERDPDVNFGNDIVLLADRDSMREALLQFHVDQLDGTVSSARLRLWVVNATTNGPKVWRSGTFEEDTVTWEAGRPTRTSVVADIGSVSSGRWIEIDVTDAINGTGTYGFTLVPDSTDGVDFTSAEGSSNQPELIVETGTSGSSSTTASTSGSTSSTSSTSPSTTTTFPQPTSGPFRAMADSTIVEASPNQTDGSGLQVLSDSSPLTRALLRFVVPSGADASAGYKLRLWVTNASSNGPEVWTTETFDEASVRWSTAPPLGRMVADFGSISSGRWVEIDVTGEVDGPGTYNLALVADATDGSDFSSRESGANAPQLVIGAPPAASTTTSSATTSSTSSTSSTTRPPASGSTFEIGVIGDTGYHAAEIDGLRDTVADMNRLGMTFGLHAGDIWGGGTSCSDSKYREMRDIFNDLNEAFVYVPGDNEWKDCTTSTSGRLSFLRNLFFSTSSSLGVDPVTLDRQSGQPENAMWVHQGVVFATMNEPGSSGASGTMKDNNVAWLNDAFDEAERTNAPGVLIMWQDNPFRPSGGALYRVLEDRTAQFGRPVTLVHGDTHNYKVDQPWSGLDNFTRVETFGGNADGEWVRITIDPQSADVFSFTREKP